MKLRHLLPVLALVLPVICSARQYTEPADTSRVDRSGWASTSGPVRLTWASKNDVYRQFATPPAFSVTDTIVDCWRGERLGLEALLIAPEATPELRVELSDLRRDGHSFKAPGSNAAFMRYVLASDWNTCGYPSDTLPAHTRPDMIDLPSATVSLPAHSMRPVWLTIEVPSDLEPGDYQMTLNVLEVKKKKSVGSLSLTLRVNRRQLPAGQDMAFYLDLWQQPYSVSRYYGVKPWSPEHLDLLRPYAGMLARAGQKTVTAILFYEPWGEQSNDKFEPMVETIKLPDGSWAYDYTILDRYVEFMDSAGIRGEISCFTMVPWEMKFRYFDKASGEYKFLEAKTCDPAYEQLWTDFLRSLASHMKERGWYDRTSIVMDERGLTDMLNARRIAQKAVPGIRMSLAGSYHSELIDSLETYTLIKGDFFPDDVISRRRQRGMTTLMYTCCATPAPSQFTNSDPADGAYIPVYATATGHDGYLHWSFMNWTDNPLEDTRFHMFAPGDTYFVYPDGRTSVRYERMVEGIQMSEKLRILRDEFTAARDVEALLELENALIPIRSGALNPWYPTSTVVDHLQEAITRLSR